MRLIVNTHTHTLVRVVGYLQQGATNPRGWRLRTKARHTQTQILCSALDYLSDTLHTIIHFFVGWCTSTAATGWRIANRVPLPYIRLSVPVSVSVSQNKRSHAHTNTRTLSRFAD